MRIGNGLWVSGGSGVAGFWLLLSFFAVFFAILFTLVQLLASLIAEAAKHAAERKAKQEAKEQASRVMATAIPLSQVVNPVSGSKVSVMRKLWGAYALVPAVGQTSILSGQYPQKLRRLVDENARGAVLLLGVFDDLSVAKAAADAVRSGAHQVDESNVLRIVGFRQDGSPIVDNT
jgi:hypothetical protein